MRSLALVVPCKNEAGRIDVGAFLDAIARYPYLSLLFVDDGSTDDTSEILAFLARQSPAIHSLYLPTNVGKAEAVRTGVNWLLENTACEAVGFWDADLATPLSEVENFVRTLESAEDREAVIGARWPHLGVNINRNPFRMFTGKVMKMLIRLILRAPIYDTQCGAKVFRRELAVRVFAERFLSRWLFDVEIFKRMPRQELLGCVAEVSLSSWTDVEGSKFRFWDSVRVLPDLVRIALCRGGVADDRV